MSNETKKSPGSFLHHCSLHCKCVMKAQLALCCKMAPKSLGARCVISAAPGSCVHSINLSTHTNTPSSGLLPCSRGCLKLSFVVLVEISRCGNTRWCVCMYSMCECVSVWDWAITTCPNPRYISFRSVLKLWCLSKAQALCNSINHICYLPFKDAFAWWAVVSTVANASNTYTRSSFLNTIYNPGLPETFADR